MTGRRVAEVMLRSPIVLAATAPVEQARAVLASSHVHMVPLTASGRVGEPLLGTVLGDDLPAPGRQGGDSVLAHARLVGRTVRADLRAEDARRAMRTAGHRRLAVVDDTGRLLGLLCLKRSGEGFCTDAGVQSRRAGRAADAPSVSADLGGS